MATIKEKIQQIEEEIRKTPYHKGTEHHLGKLKAKLAKLKDQLLEPRKKGKKIGFALKKEGDATVVLLGFPSVGKSTLLNKLTGAVSKVGAYDFTTLTVIPGVLKFRGAKIQILDLPGIISGAAKGKGRGRLILSAARVADLLLVLTDVLKPEQETIIKKELYEAGVFYLPLPILFVVNKIDLIKNPKDLKNKFPQHFLISAKENLGLSELKKAIWKKLDLIRIYLRPKKGEVDFNKPLILRKGATVLKAAEKVSSELAQEIKKAKIYGKKARYQGQMVGPSYLLSDGTILTFLVS